jgi:hypothetical protein
MTTTTHPHRDVPLPARLLPTEDGASLRQVAAGRHVFVGAVKHFPPDAVVYPGYIFRPAGDDRGVYGEYRPEVYPTGSG